MQYILHVLECLVQNGNGIARTSTCVVVANLNFDAIRVIRSGVTISQGLRYGNTYMYTAATSGLKDCMIKTLGVDIAYRDYIKFALSD